MTAALLDRLSWVLIEHRGQDPSTAVHALVKEIESTHLIIDPDVVTEEMLQACYRALPECYDPPDPKRLPWHKFKAVRRFSAMVRAAPKLCTKS